MANKAFININPFYILTFAVLIVLTIPILIQDGMFMDGEQYACVSRNLANGKGSFWFPFLSETWYMEGSTHFMEHPTLFYWLQSQFFKILGNSIYTERIYSIIILILNAFLIHRIWELIVPNYSTISWIPILLWIITPVCFWSAQNNIIEFTLTTFTLTATYFILKGIIIPKYILVNLIIGAVFIFLSFLIKGFQGLFPLSIVCCYYISNGTISLQKTITYTLLILAIPIALFLALVVLNTHAHDSLLFYINHRLLVRIENNPNVENRFYVVFLLIQELIPMLIVLIISLFFKIKNIVNTQNQFLLMLFIGLSASIPLMLTYVQKNFYFAASIPFFAIAIALLISEKIKNLIKNIDLKSKSYHWLKIASIGLLIGVVVFSGMQIGKVSRDNDEIEDVTIIGNFLNKQTTVDCDIDTYNAWSFQFYLLRKFDISIEPAFNKRKYYITNKNFYACRLFNYKPVFLPTKKYKVFEQIN